MKTYTHTPGPWHTNGVLIMNEKGSTVGRVGHIENYEANAHLIAAAPDMLKALKMAVEMFDEMSADDMAPLVRRSAKNLAMGAIKLAEGRI